MSTFQIYLASTSPRRRELLDQLGVRYCTRQIEVDETWRAWEVPDAYVLRLALAKAHAGWQARDSHLACPALGADTAVVVEGEVLGKPRDCEHGLAMLERLSGHSHQVLSAIALVDGVREVTRLSVSTVTFRAITAAERAAYWKTGEPLGKAGGYAIQGRAAVFIARLEGSFSGVMGLPLYETADALSEFGIDVLSSGKPRGCQSVILPGFSAELGG